MKKMVCEMCCGNNLVTEDGITAFLKGIFANILLQFQVFACKELRN